LILRARKYRIDLITARKVRLKGKNEAVSVHEVFGDYAAELSMANVSGALSSDSTRSGKRKIQTCQS